MPLCKMTQSLEPEAEIDVRRVLEIYMGMRVAVVTH